MKMKLWKKQQQYETFYIKIESEDPLNLTISYL